LRADHDLNGGLFAGYLSGLPQQLENWSGGEDRGEAFPVTAARKKASRKSARKKSKEKCRQSDLEILQEIQDEIYERLKSSDYQPKVADLIKVLDEKLKLRMRLSEDGKKAFWDLIEQIRSEELGGDDEDE
jgi:flagellar motility protein MotE (MotC chaperone)